MKHGKKAKRFILQRSWIYVISQIQNRKSSSKKTQDVLYVPRADFVKDDTGSHAVSTEQGPSVSHVTAATVLDVVSRRPPRSQPWQAGLIF